MVRIRISHGAPGNVDGTDWFVVHPLDGRPRQHVSGGELNHDMATQSLLRAGRAVYELELPDEPEDARMGLCEGIWRRITSIPAPDIDWPLDNGANMTVTRKAGDIYVIQDLNSDRQLTLSWNHQTGTGYSRLLFDGQDIETESYMGYVGLMDEMTEELGENGVGTITMENKW